MKFRLLAFAALLPLAATASADAPDVVAQGKLLFRQQWVAAPSPTHTGDGLGPLFDARSCDTCHANAGPGIPGLVSPMIGAGLLVRLGRPDGGGDPVYGRQLQMHALPDVPVEATAIVQWNFIDDRRVPALRISNLGYGPLDAHTTAALRRAPSLYGAATLQAIPDAEILAVEAREHEAGMNGHAAMLTDASGQHIGRFGWKAVAPDLAGQIENALERDMGLSTSRYPDPWGDCTEAETACRDLARRNADRPIEVPDASRDAIAAYLESLPAPQPLDAASRGAQVFQNAGCSACHTELKAKDGAPVPALTDLLLHDMGPELEDHIAEGAAKSSEWRTAPLWSLREELLAGGLLHDGRARTIAEAVSWHGGDAAPSRARFSALTADDKTAIESYLLRR